MSVKAAITVSIAPVSTSALNWSGVSTKRPYRSAHAALKPSGGRLSFTRSLTPRRTDELPGTTGTCAGRGRAHAPQARLRAGAVPGDGRVPELRHLVHDHLDPRRLPDVVLHRDDRERDGEVLEPA